jgi:endoglucanase
MQVLSGAHQTLKAVSRRALLAGVSAALPLTGFAQGVTPGFPKGPGGQGRGYEMAHADWLAFKRRFIAPEGRVVDTGNNGVSHSEGQGIGMLSAVHFGDQETFDSLATWTNAHLIRATDRLYSWRYRPNQINPVDDPNNATDGDMLIAWAMLEAGRKWGSAAYRDAGVQIAENIRAALVRPMGDKLVLLPGTYGFVHADRTVLNPSYYVFPALHRFASEAPHPAWAQLWKDGVGLLREARYGRWGLPADWIAMEDGASANPRIADGWPARFSWDAVRVPLYMSWVGMAQEPAVASAVQFWDNYPSGTAPAWTDLQSGAVAPYGQSCGLRAVQVFSTAMHHKRENIALPSAVEAQDYYAAALTLLVHIAHATRDDYATPVV